MMDYELYGILVINVLMLDLFNLFWLFFVDILQQAVKVQAGRACTSL